MIHQCIFTIGKSFKFSEFRFLIKSLQRTTLYFSSEHTVELHSILIFIETYVRLCQFISTNNTYLALLLCEMLVHTWKNALNVFGILICIENRPSVVIANLRAVHRYLFMSFTLWGNINSHLSIL